MVYKISTKLEYFSIYFIARADNGIELVWRSTSSHRNAKLCKSNTNNIDIEVC